jgi:hypothetical protein
MILRVARRIPMGANAMMMLNEMLGSAERVQVRGTAPPPEKPREIRE